MKSQTEQPVKQRTTRSNKPKKYNRQTAHVEARRDGKPLIFGWGKHLSHTEKVRIQRRATCIITSILGLLVIRVLVWSWLNINVIIPGEPITSVNGHQIPQSQFRKLVALKTQLEDNLIYGQHGLYAQRTDLE